MLVLGLRSELIKLSLLLLLNFQQGPSGNSGEPSAITHEEGKQL